ncbi:hypothetical protein CVT24_001804 [Panaeolus cyanescens]|uniref:Uncharacterized protein n=1 Tax=Panaeolus cyanescens TaxID=181874 RepID=A0A409YFK8_9AGAR|nr:hypothetical protein CVT24_001804 [Panaeolus cyanescens]
MSFSTKCLIIVLAAQILAGGALPHGMHHGESRIGKREPGIGGLVKGIENVVGMVLREEAQPVAREPRIGGLVKGIENVVGMVLREEGQPMSHEQGHEAEGAARGHNHVAHMVAREPEPGLGG